MFKIGAMALLAATAALALRAYADSYFEVESARANARAGGPGSERDAELLDRYGCLSGTRSRFCQERERYHTRREQDRDRRSR